MDIEQARTAVSDALALLVGDGFSGPVVQNLTTALAALAPSAPVVMPPPAPPVPIVMPPPPPPPAQTTLTLGQGPLTPGGSYTFSTQGGRAHLVVQLGNVQAPNVRVQQAGGNDNPGFFPMVFGAKRLGTWFLTWGARQQLLATLTITS